MLISLNLDAKKIITRSVITAILSLGISGCALNSILINYPSQISPIKAQLNNPKSEPLYRQFDSKIAGADGLLYAQEAGRVAQILGDFQTSNQYYAQAVSAYQKFDDKALISASDLGANASSLLINDNVIPYRGPGYERILVHQYQALNYLLSGDSQSALVEVRRSNELQAMEQARYEKSMQSVQSMANGAIDAEMDKLSAAAGSTTSSFLNAYSYYTTGLIYELLGQPNDAFIDYRKAAQITPSNPYLQQDLVRLAKRLSMPQYEEFKKRWGDAKLPSKTEGQVVVLLERGFVPEKQSFTVPFRIQGNWQTASLATYLPTRASVPTGQITGLGPQIKASPIANIDALAITALKEELPAALVRQAARVYAKAEMAQSVRSDTKRQHDQFDAGALAIQLFNIVTEQADRRSWLTLPKQAQIARQYVAAGRYGITLDQGARQTIDVQQGKTTLIWIIDTGNYTRFYSIII
ncbi:hypothetical protein LZP69_01280 [Shewanella sp. AS1]|uniref:COG3014 family protein n=1 Tax=Shewanella sp. AS1 TaxID=2907626 RepID=UPI001F337DA7|nr:hypothetical protein [Shewanella sp. AS1]MCE9677824.1 hypothetical protein [Shewanella sp. AS1]